MKKRIGLIVIIVFILGIIFIIFAIGRKIKNEYYLDTKGLLLEIKRSNYGPVEFDKDYWKERITAIYYSGRVIQYDIYNLSGIKNMVKSSLSEEKINELKNLLNKDFKTYNSSGITFDYSLPKYIYYGEDGEKIKSFSFDRTEDGLTDEDRDILREMDKIIKTLRK